mmetsp:Transcript_12974/g.37473  ORF Transcript_12974/g.37473 Transcript_12974/m.37473 type:complete len:87 (-) Transcript_12974:110-370(-)
MDAVATLLGCCMAPSGGESLHRVEKIIADGMTSKDSFGGKAAATAPQATKKSPDIARTRSMPAGSWSTRAATRGWRPAAARCSKLL